MKPFTGPTASWDEFSPMREVVVGTGLGARIPPLTDPSAWLTCYPELTWSELEKIQQGAYPSYVVEETQEDLAELVVTLEQLGVLVHRPTDIDHETRFTGIGWESSGRSAYCPRDLALVLGPNIIETASPMRARYFELFALRKIFNEYFKQGSRFLAVPRPQLESELYLQDNEGSPVLSEAEPVFEAANCLRLGRDIFYQVSRSGNNLGLMWLESMCELIGDMRVHPLRGLYEGTHIDSTIAILRPGLVLLNPERVSPETVPTPFQGWDKIWCPPMCVSGEIDYPLSTPWVGMNLLMVDPGTAIVDALQTDLIRQLERHGITVIPRILRHSRLLGGGFHCVTLDTVRDGNKEDYINY